MLLVLAGVLSFLIGAAISAKKAFSRLPPPDGSAQVEEGSQASNAPT
jgi:hypothetical protein